ncbi:type 1 glutamine amidotransferase [Roseobacter weihaiensis]|uniref:type 1 glutamine amidotransferase n=1 Tax=Roseobacter weihaiensis TaxID=2763262 RepID=UPI001D0A1300|nr:type 1 glutamine amidotransferase [Roseobacter sp. H9]
MQVLIFQHVASERPAAFSDHIAAAGDTAHVVRFYQGDPIPALTAFDALIVMGGPMDVWESHSHRWLIAEKAAIARWVRDLGKPYLGICLGHQLLVDALGGTCQPLATPTVAIGPVARTGAPDLVFDTLPARFPVLQWHGVAATRLPPDSITLAGSPACRHQAIRVGPHAWGVQFHPEITAGLVRGWLTDPANMAAAVQWFGSQNATEAFVTECDAHSGDALVQSATLYEGLRRSVPAQTPIGRAPPRPG